MKTYTATFMMPTGWIGADYEEEQFFTFDDDVSDDDIVAEIESEFSSWVEDIIEDLRMSAEYVID